MSELLHAFASKLSEGDVGPEQVLARLVPEIHIGYSLVNSLSIVFLSQSAQISHHHKEGVC